MLLAERGLCVQINELRGDGAFQGIVVCSDGAVVARGSLARMMGALEQEGRSRVGRNVGGKRTSNQRNGGWREGDWGILREQQKAFSGWR